MKSIWCPGLVSSEGVRMAIATIDFFNLNLKHLSSAGNWTAWFLLAGACVSYVSFVHCVSSIRCVGWKPGLSLRATVDDHRALRGGAYGRDGERVSAVGVKISCWFFCRLFMTGVGRTDGRTVASAGRYSMYSSLTLV